MPVLESAERYEILVVSGRTVPRRWLCRPLVYFESRLEQLRPGFVHISVRQIVAQRVNV